MKKNWQTLLNQAVTKPQDLFHRLKLDQADLPAAYQAHLDFPIRVPQAWLKKIEKANPKDPLLLQVLPVAQELIDAQGFVPDPLNEIQKNPLPGVLHKYQSRVLLVTAGSCAINCRYCFRRHFPYAENQQGQQQWESAVAYLADHPEINEVILSGGEPLMLPDRQLAGLTKKLSKIEHLKVLRIHTRMPVFIPERLDQDFMAWFINDRFKPILVTHINHPAELDTKLYRKMQQLKRKGVVLFNQTVLLKGINDQAAILKQLSEKLFFEAGIQPYYLHLLDKVKGAAHFDITKAQALTLYKELQSLLPGYLVPKLVEERAGEKSKTLII